MVYRPVPERPVQEVLDAVDAIVANTGGEIALLSLSSSDYRQIENLVRGLVARHGPGICRFRCPACESRRSRWI
jgi:hypothetical protein